MAEATKAEEEPSSAPQTLSEKLQRGLERYGALAFVRTQLIIACSVFSLRCCFVPQLFSPLERQPTFLSDSMDRTLCSELDSGLRFVG